MQKYKVKILDIIKENDKTRTFMLEIPQNYNWIPASHFHVGLDGFDKGDEPDKSLVHHLSIMSLQEENKLGFTTRILENKSIFKEALSKLSVGDYVTLFKLDNRMKIRREDKNIVLLSQGVGIATMRPIIRHILNNRENIKSITNMNIDSSKEYIYKDELDELQNNFYKNIWVDSRKNFYSTIDNLTNNENIYYIVGGDDFIKTSIKYLLDKNINKTDIIIDKKPERIQEFFE